MTHEVEEFWRQFGAVAFGELLPVLAEHPEVQRAIRAARPEEGDAILDAIRARPADDASELHAFGYDYARDLVHNEAVDELNIEALGGDGMFYISIMRFGPIYFIFAPEFDDVGYFTSLEDAEQCARFNYEPFITELEEEAQLSDGDE